MPKRTRQNKKRSNARNSRKQRGGNAPFCLEVGKEYNINGTMKKYLGPKQDLGDTSLFHNFEDKGGFTNDELNNMISFKEKA